MDKRAYFLKAIKAKKYEDLNWIIGLFSITKVNSDKPLQFYELNQTAVQMLFMDPENKNLENQLTVIDDAVPGQPLFKPRETLDLKAGDLPNLFEDVTTTYGNVIFNCCAIINAFGSKMPYINGSVSVDALESSIAKKLKDNPVDPLLRKDNEYYVDELIKFSDGLVFLTGLTQVCVWGATEKVITPPPGLKEYKKKLLEEFAGRLSDPTVIAEIDKRLVAFDAEYLKGDPGGDNFLVGSKMRNVTRKKMFLMLGGEAGLDEKSGLDLIQNSLNEGWQIDKFPAMNNSLRAGSFNRGAETQLGGESVKWLLRASSNIKALDQDCGSTMGRLTLVDKSNDSKLIGFTALVNNQKVKFEESKDYEPYLGKKLLIRSPLYCLLEKTDYCFTCIGDSLAKNPTGLSLAISEYGSGMMGIFLAKMHGTQLAVATMDYKSTIS
jgi:hypothetical protein